MVVCKTRNSAYVNDPQILSSGTNQYLKLWE